VVGWQHELTNYRITSGKCCVRSDGHRAIGAASDTPRGTGGRSSDAVVAKCAGLHNFGRSESLDVETRSHADQMNESGPMRSNPGVVGTERAHGGINRQRISGGLYFPLVILRTRIAPQSLNYTKTRLERTTHRAA